VCERDGDIGHDLTPVVSGVETVTGERFRQSGT
jgi:hypothetical protein